MATNSSILAWKIPWTEKPGGLQSVHGVAKIQTRLCTHTIEQPLGCSVVWLREKEPIS